MARTLSWLVPLAITSLFAFQSMSSVAGEPETKTAADAGTSYFQFAIFNPIQLIDESKSISGLRLTLLYSKNVEVSGIDLGLDFNRLTGNITGIQIAGLGNFSGNVSGIQASIFMNGALDTRGIQVSAVNLAQRIDPGVQLGLINHASAISGVQFGFVNRS